MNKPTRTLFNIQKMSISIPSIRLSVSGQTNLVFIKPEHLGMNKSIFNNEQFTDMGVHKFTEIKDELLKKIDCAETVTSMLFSI